MASRKPKLLEISRRLALQAGQAILDVRAGIDADVTNKPDGSPVTRADFLADAIISDGLMAAFPNIALVTEERTVTHQNVATGEFFLIDPLDGTKDFIGGDADFTVNIALIRGGTPVFGLVYAPAHGRLFYTDDTGAAVEEVGPFDIERPGRTIALTVCDDCSGALVVVASKSHRDAATDRLISDYRIGDLRATGSSLKFCLVASGESHLYPRLGRTMEWDTAAGDAVLRAAGGKMLCLATRKPFVYGKPGFENGPFIAAAQGVKIRR